MHFGIAISGSTYVTFVNVIITWSKWNWKVNEGKNPSYKIQLSLDKRFDCRSGRKIQLSYKVSFPRRPFRHHESRTLVPNIQISWEFTTEVCIK